MSRKFFSVFVIALSQVAIMAIWFSASAIAPSLQRIYSLDANEISLLTSAVQLGFVVGALISAAFGLSDRLDPRRLILGAGLTAAALNLVFLVIYPGSILAVIIRFLCGMCMALVYPVGMKIMASWAATDTEKGGRTDRGLLVAILVAALTLGSSSPHLFNFFGGLDWRVTIFVASLSAAAGALLVLLAKLGPLYAPSPSFRVKDAFAAFTQPSLRLVNFGYLGHMWELYAMWAWIIVFFEASFFLDIGNNDAATLMARLATFVVIGGGGVIGCIVAGFMADRIGRTTLTIIAMAGSGVCAVLIGFFYGQDVYLVMAVAFIWGAFIIADSAQFSAGVSELAQPDKIGTMLTVQTAAGFLLTLVSIHLIPSLVQIVGWEHAFAFLAIGPAIGIVSMARLRRHPDAVKMAGGKR
ncbi:MAG: MFS transporter, partial [Alphaproteobacteria bacterium]|nr:MFS transporter [Alphaproteobacteria bacterium]